MNEPWHKVERSGYPVIYKADQWIQLFDGLEIGVSSRLGGVSQGNYQSLNCGLHVDDCPEDVIHNRRRLASATAVRWENWTYAEQIHGDHVAVVTREHKGSGIDSRERALQNTDAMITNEPDISLTLLFADCVPIFFIDPVRRVIAIAHAGWKGTVRRIAANTIQHMVRNYNSEPEHIRSLMGPSIRSCCYEVDDTVIRQVDAVMEELQADHPVYLRQSNQRYLLDLQQLNRQIMIEAGILPTHIEISNLCTSCHTDLFFSHRAEKGTTGRMAAWIAMSG